MKHEHSIIKHSITEYMKYMKKQTVQGFQRFVYIAKLCTILPNNYFGIKYCSDFVFLFFDLKVELTIPFFI